MQDLNTENKPETSARGPSTPQTTNTNLNIETDALVSHKPIKQQNPLLQCKYCLKRYKVRKALEKHEQCCLQKEEALTNQPESQDHKLSKKVEEVQERKGYTCKDCGQTFKYARILQKHETSHKEQNSHWCQLCMVSFATYEEKVLHKMKQHPNKNKKLKCRICPSINFELEEEYLYHITEVHKGKCDDYYMCSECGKQFKTKSELTHHNNSKCGTIRQYNCHVCGQNLMTAGSLHNHMLRHSGTRSSMCGYCGKMFLTAGQLKVHERTHTQEKAFVCQVCGKGFCHRQSLITHSTLHTGVKPYQCDNCGHSFSCVGNLLKHRKTHADTCGVTPLTTHRVNNPSTKLKIKINTPKNSKLKMMRKEKEMQEKLAAYKAKLNTNHGIPENEYNQANGKFLSSQSSDCSSYQGIEDDCNDNSEHLSSCEFQAKTEIMNDVPYIPNGFLQKQYRIEEMQFKETYENHSADKIINSNSIEEIPNEKQSDNSETNLLKLNDNSLEHSNKFSGKERILNNLNSKTDVATEDAIDLPVIDINNTLGFEEINSNANNCQNKISESSNNYVCQAEDLNDNFKVNCYVNEHASNIYYSNVCDNAKIEQEFGVNKDKRNENPIKANRKVKKSKQEKTVDKEMEEFVKQRKGATEGTCRYCQKVYANLRWLFRHEKEHEKKTEQAESKSKTCYKCSCCKVGFETREECRIHQQSMHADILTCHDCDKLFSNVDSLRSHQNIFHKGLPKRVYLYICDKCGLQFRQKAFLVHHEKSNCGTGPVYECHVCGKSFNSMHTCRSHLRIHDPKKRFLCKFCGKNFRWKGQLKIHERSHTGEKPFKCLYCPKAFAYRESLVTHSSLHTGIKPHLCQACGSRFSCIGNLIKHRATHASTCGVWYSKNQ